MGRESRGDSRLGWHVVTGQRATGLHPALHGRGDPRRRRTSRRPGSRGDCCLPRGGGCSRPPVRPLLAYRSWASGLGTDGGEARETTSADLPSVDVCALGLLAATLVITWFGKTDEREPSWLVLPAEGPALCGKLALEQGRLVLRQSGERAVALDGSDAKTVLPAPRCPR